MRIVIEYCNEPEYIETVKEQWSKHGTYDYDPITMKFTTATSIYWRTLNEIQSRLSNGEMQGTVPSIGGVYRWRLDTN